MIKRFTCFDDIIRIVAYHICVRRIKVDVHNPDILLSIELRQEAAYIFTHTYLGAGGYP